MVNIIMRFLKCSLLVSLVASCQASSVGNGAQAPVESSASQQEFLDLFDYEIQNRAFARNSLTVSVDKNIGTERHEFYKAYLALEHLSVQRLTPVAAKYGLGIEARWWTRFRTSLGGVASRMMPDLSISAIHRAAVNYLSKLERLEALASETDKPFFRYVVAQEQAQIDAMALVIAGKSAQGAELLQQFILDNQAPAH